MKIKLFAMLAFVLMLASGCLKQEILYENAENVPAMIEESGIVENTDNYISWVNLKGLKQSHYEAVLAYTEGYKDVVTEPIKVNAIQYWGSRRGKNVFISEQNDGNVIIRKYQCNLIVCYSEFEIPISFVVEKAFLKNCENEICMPTLDTEYTLAEPLLTELEDEEIGDKQYYCYQLSCCATALTGDVVSEAQSIAKIMVEKQPITFDPPSVDPWDDVEVKL